MKQREAETQAFMRRIPKDAGWMGRPTGIPAVTEAGEADEQSKMTTDQSKCGSQSNLSDEDSGKFETPKSKKKKKVSIKEEDNEHAPISSNSEEDDSDDDEEEGSSDDS